MYKVIAQVVGDVDTTLADTLAELNIRITKEEMKSNIRPLLRLVCNRFLGDFSGFVNMCVEHIRSPLDNAKTKVDHIFTGPKEGEMYSDMIQCNQNGSLMVHSSKMYPTDDCTFFQVSFFLLSSHHFYFNRFIFSFLGFGTCCVRYFACWPRSSCAG